MSQLWELKDLTPVKLSLYRDRRTPGPDLDARTVVLFLCDQYPRLIELDLRLRNYLFAALPELLRYAFWPSFRRLTLSLIYP